MPLWEVRNYGRESQSMCKACTITRDDIKSEVFPQDEDLASSTKFFMYIFCYFGISVSPPDFQAEIKRSAGSMVVSDN